MFSFFERRIAIKLVFEDRTLELDDPARVEKELKKAKAIAIRVDGELLDISSASTLRPDSEVRPVSVDSPEGLDLYRHSTSHIMAHAVKELFPDAKIAIGPSIEDGFYYDFEISRPLTPEDLDAIEKKMAQIIKKADPFLRREMSRRDAIELFRKQGESYKVELLEELDVETVSLYEEGGFLDLCRGPHLPGTSAVKAYKLLSVAGAYWRGDEKRKMLQRVYGTAFASQDDLKKHLEFLEEVKKRDHRRIGKDLDLFSINEEIGPGLILWHPDGATIRLAIEDFWRQEHVKSGYQILYTPHIARLNLWNTSGHTEFYTDNMYSPMEVEGQPYEIKPMNCPFHIAIYKNGLHSYREFPIKYAELGTVYRYERSGVLHGLLRVRGFTQDDAHIFMREDQMEDEIIKVLDFVIYILTTFGFKEFDTYLSTRPEKYVGTDEHWATATSALEAAMKAKGLRYEVDEGGGAFYGPKIDIKVKDSLNRSWQCSTIQVDFNLPERFDMTYRGKDGREHRPIMIHRALMGSLERFFGVLLEHHAGALPLWLTPRQVGVLTITERHGEYASEVAAALLAEGIRAFTDLANEKIGYKIREATVKKVPYLVIIGDKELEDRKVTVRKRSGENIGPFDISEFAAMLKEEISSRR